MMPHNAAPFYKDFQLKKFKYIKIFVKKIVYMITTKRIGRLKFVDLTRFINKIQKIV